MVKLNVFLVLIICFFSWNLYADNKEANVNVILELEGEYKFEPFPESSPGIEGLLSRGVMRVIKKSKPGLPKYAALNEAMQKARREVYSATLYSHITEMLTVKQAVATAPPYKEYRPRTAAERERFGALSDEERAVVTAEKGRDKSYDFDKVTDTIRECGKYKNSGRFYDAVEKVGHVCLQVSLEEFYSAVENDKINIFTNVSLRTNYRPMDRVSGKYDSVIIDAREIEYKPNLRVNLLSPTEEIVYAGLGGKSKLFYARDIDGAKKVLAANKARRAFNIKAVGVTGNVGLRVSLPGADRIHAAVSRNKDIPVVIIYNVKEETETTEIIEEKIPAVGE